MEMNIGANIKRLRNKKNITQEQLATAMNISCAAVSKWERGETYPDITLLQPLAYFFEVTLDELMGYDQEKIRAEIDEVVDLFLKTRSKNSKLADEIICKAYRDYPNDYRIMNYYMWRIAGDADNDPEIMLAHKDEFLGICDKILDGCMSDRIRLDAWNMRAKLLHAEGKTDEALDIYQNKFITWWATSGQKIEQLFAKNTEEFYYWLNKNMYELVAFAGDKLAKTICYDKRLSTKEMAEKALKYGKLMIDALNETGDAFFAGLAEAFISQVRNYLTFKGNDESDIVALLDLNLYVAEKIAEREKTDKAIHEAYFPNRISVTDKDFLTWIVNAHLNPRFEKHKNLLNNPDYVAVLKKYQK